MKRERITGSHTTRQAHCLVEGSSVLRRERICVEKVIHLSLNNEPLANLVASPHQLRELGAGFVISEGLARDIEKVEVEGDRIRVYAASGVPSGERVTESSGGLSMGGTPGTIVSRVVIEADDVFKVISEIVSELWEMTGGAHCSVLFSRGRIVAKSSDIGRHNTVDKVIGSAVLTGLDLSYCVLGCTGRQPAGMVRKAANAGIPIIVSKAATTDEGITLARRSGLTLICRVREQSFCVYSHPWRVAGLGADDTGEFLKKGRSCREKQ
ncbi:MAG TPA: formate dehydrogenase accessory sulfurtransferase FdhD [Deltaproteobacteria bacterium]|nr:formate dehydrogenase accessory sulfurtransferase FdhD [Deltaproteobacteria bacterium]